MTESRRTELRRKIDRMNQEMLRLIQERGQLVVEIADGYDPRHEEDVLRDLSSLTEGPFLPGEVRRVFRAIHRASLEMQERLRRETLRVHRRDRRAAEVRVGGVTIGAGEPVLFLGPCSVETPEQIDAIAGFVAGLAVTKVLRAGLFKARTNPYTFQGLREDGLQLLRDTADRHGLPFVTEVLDTATVELVAAHADMLQVGARSMFNTELLKAVGRAGKPVLLKRAFMATIEEFLLAAEYLLSYGSESVVLCERGIRTFERATRNTLDISAIPLLKQETSLPVIVDLSHALGRKDIMPACARAALAAGADGLMIEIHDRPEQALSDGYQQLDLDELVTLLDSLPMATPARLRARRFRPALKERFERAE
jgi:3-deoxy-7-phosphoheptulonate synthase/chorismate mutase